MKIQEICSTSSLYRAALKLRHRLFFADFGLPIEITCDQLEEKSTHFAMTEYGELVAYSRLTELRENEFKISQIAVEPEHQGKGHGREIITHVIEIAKSSSGKQIELNSQTSASDLYRKFGFQEVGEVKIVELTGIPHIRMMLKFCD
ncbi:MAG: GNAT family N-acetyltransferase [Gammaproteobacteria bacterium]|nr:GNAT family N-acetyltransferase [Gammaproteobacteria bacterium]MDG2336585.1 GNAT family N-acetyltransferase [Gammaproteobacteria bacterium]